MVPINLGLHQSKSVGRKNQAQWQGHLGRLVGGGGGGSDSKQGAMALLKSSQIISIQF